MHTTSTVRQEPKLKENEPWAMPSPEAGPSRSATNATTDFERSELSDTPTQKSSDASDSVSSQIQPSTSSSSSSVPKPNLPKSRTRLPEWIPPHWQSHLQPDAQWRKDMLNRRKRLAQQAGQQLTVLGMKLNEVTGYKEVERLKELVGEKGKSSIRNRMKC
jgi:sensitive to high expression protein 9